MHNKRIIKLLIQQMELLDEALEEQIDIYFLERPFLTGGEMVVHDLESQRREKKIEINQIVLGIQSTWNQLI